MPPGLRETPITRARRLSSLLRRSADALEESAALAERGADRSVAQGRSMDAAEERRVAGRAREAAELARSHAAEAAKREASDTPDGQD